MVWYEEGNLILSLPAHLILEGSQVRSAAALLYTAADTAEVAALLMEQQGERYTARWRGAAPGEYLVAVKVEDEAGNSGRSGLRRIYARPPLAEWPDTEVPILGQGRASSVAYSPDGQLLAVGSSVGVWLYDATTLAELGLLEGGQVRAVAFSPDSRLLASGGGSDDPAIRLWDLEARRLAGILVGHRSSVEAVAFSLDGKLLASGGGDGTVRLWEVGEQQAVGVLKGHTGEVFVATFSPDGRTLASGSLDSTVRLWDVQDQRQIGLLKGSAQINELAFSPDARWLVSGGSGIVQVWDVLERREVAVLDPEWFGSPLALSPDGRTLASGGETAVYLWEMGEGRQLGALEGHGYYIQAVAFSPDGRLLAVGDGEGAVRVWDWARQQELARLKKHTASVVSVLFSPDGQILASGSQDGTVRLWHSAVLAAVEEEAATTPLTFSLSPAYPNPFNPTTTIRFILPQPGEAELVIYNLLGQRVTTLVHGPQEAGPHVLQWDGRDDQGRELASGVYFYRLQAGEQVETRRLLLLR